MIEQILTSEVNISERLLYFLGNHLLYLDLVSHGHVVRLLISLMNMT